MYINTKIMKKKYLGLRTCIYRVPDMEKARAWYSRAFETEPYFDEPFYMGFNIGGFELGVQPEEDESHKVRGGNCQTYWGVEDIQTVFNHLLACGATVHEDPKNVGGDLMVASVEDPWGNIIGLIYNPHFKAE